jgi:hypothetical protein
MKEVCGGVDQCKAISELLMMIPINPPFQKLFPVDWKLGKNQVTRQMKCDAMALVAFVHFAGSNGGIAVRLKLSIGPVDRIE